MAHPPTLAIFGRLGQRSQHQPNGYDVIKIRTLLIVTALGLASILSATRADEPAGDSPKPDFVPLFTQDGPPAEWLVREWSDLSKPAPDGVQWLVKEGVLYGSQQRGTWLISKAQYGDFELQFDFKLGERGNSGCALRSPLYGDPAFDGLELQMADLRYNPDALDSELTGGIYRAVAPKQQLYKPTEWNQLEIKLVEYKLLVRLNGEVIHDLDLFDQHQEVKRHDGTLASPVKDRPRRGHIGFQELSRGGSQVQIRNARIRVLDQPAKEAGLESATSAQKESATSNGKAEVKRTSDPGGAASES